MSGDARCCSLAGCRRRRVREAREEKLRGGGGRAGEYEYGCRGRDDREWCIGGGAV